jgi:hypothetical protein
MDKVWKPSNFEYYTPSSEPIGIYLETYSYPLCRDMQNPFYSYLLHFQVVLLHCSNPSAKTFSDNIEFNLYQ